MGFGFVKLVSAFDRMQLASIYKADKADGEVLIAPRKVEGGRQR